MRVARLMCCRDPWPLGPMATAMPVRKRRGGGDGDDAEVFASHDAAEKDGERAEEVCGEHEPAALAIGRGAIGVGDVERPKRRYGSAGGLPEKVTRGERDGDAERVAQTDPNADLRAVVKDDGAPEGHARLSGWGTGCNKPTRGRGPGVRARIGAARRASCRETGFAALR